MVVDGTEKMEDASSLLRIAFPASMNVILLCESPPSALNVEAYELKPPSEEDLRWIAFGKAAHRGILLEREAEQALVNEASRITSICGNPLLIVENQLKDALEATSNKTAIYGALTTLAFSYGFKVFQTSDRDETAQLIAVIARRRGHGDLRYASPVVRRKPRLEKTWQKQLAMVQSIPWIGGKYARRLLRNLGTVKAVFGSSPSRLTQAASIPPATAVKIHRLINRPYAENDSKAEQREVESYQ